MCTLKTLKSIINSVDAIVVGAGAGLSTAAGFEYGGKLFFDNFDYMNKKYGYTDMYSAGFHNFKSQEEKWGYWSQFIYLNRYMCGAKPLYIKLKNILEGKNYFVVTTNVDHQFQLAGFDKNRLFYTQGDYGLFQCEKACHNKTYDNQKIIMDMVKARKDGMVPTHLVPRCPVCGEFMDTNLRKDNYFVEDDGWREASKRYSDFIEANKDKKILFFELGVGYNTPSIIKYPFIRMTYNFNNAFYVCVNKGYNVIPDEIKERSLVFDKDINTVIDGLIN